MMPVTTMSAPSAMGFFALRLPYLPANGDLSGCADVCYRLAYKAVESPVSRIWAPGKHLDICPVVEAPDDKERNKEGQHVNERDARVCPEQHHYNYVCAVCEEESQSYVAYCRKHVSYVITLRTAVFPLCP